MGKWGAQGVRCFVRPGHASLPILRIHHVSAGWEPPPTHIQHCVSVSPFQVERCKGVLGRGCWRWWWPSSGAGHYCPCLVCSTTECTRRKSGVGCPANKGWVGVWGGVQIGGRLAAAPSRSQLHQQVQDVGESDDAAGHQRRVAHVDPAVGEAGQQTGPKLDLRGSGAAAARSPSPASPQHNAAKTTATATNVSVPVQPVGHNLV